MINVNELKRNAKNIVKNYSDVEVKVREATSNDPWGPSSTIMAEIADLTYNVVAFPEIMNMIWKRLNDHGKNWRHVQKSLVVLEYLIKTGTEKVAQQCIENIFSIKMLKDFQYINGNKDYGKNVREKSQKLVDLLNDPEKLKVERARAIKAKLSVNKSNRASGFPSSSVNASSMLDSSSDSARPQTITEEENQLKHALALSKEEAKQQEITRKNDDIRLKLALDVSEKSKPSASLLNEISTSVPTQTSQTYEQNVLIPTTSKSAIDDLLCLTIPPQEQQNDKNFDSDHRLLSSPLSI